MPKKQKVGAAIIVLLAGTLLIMVFYGGIPSPIEPSCSIESKLEFTIQPALGVSQLLLPPLYVDGEIATELIEGLDGATLEQQNGSMWVIIRDSNEHHATKRVVTSKSSCDVGQDPYFGRSRHPRTDEKGAISPHYSALYGKELKNDTDLSLLNVALGHAIGESNSSFTVNVRFSSTASAPGISRHIEAEMMGRIAEGTESLLLIRVGPYGTE